NTFFASSRRTAAYAWREPYFFQKASLRGAPSVAKITTALRIFCIRAPQATTSSSGCATRTRVVLSSGSKSFILCKIDADLNTEVPRSVRDFAEGRNAAQFGR